MQKLRFYIFFFCFLYILTCRYFFTFASISLDEVNGSDLGMGIGARAIGMAGAYVALANDAGAVFWNPAGLTNIKQSQISLMLDQNPFRVSLKTFIIKLPEWNKNKFNPTLSYSVINRLRYKGAGDWSTDKNASHLVDLSMINLPRNPDGTVNYIGGIDSRTTDHRISFAFDIPFKRKGTGQLSSLSSSSSSLGYSSNSKNSKNLNPMHYALRTTHYENLSAGFNFIDFKCVTTFTDGRLCQIVSYKTMDLGLLYRKTKGKQYGLMMRNILEPSKPRYITIGFAKKKSKKASAVSNNQQPTTNNIVKDVVRDFSPVKDKESVYTIDLEKVFGNYGENEQRKANFLFLRTGFEKILNNNLTGRIGLVFPLQASTSTLGNIKPNIPSPGFGGAFGLGYKYKNFMFDVAVYGDPGRSYVEHSAKLNYTFSLTLQL